MAKFCAPLIVVVWIIEPSKVLAAVPKVIAAEYVCVPDVVTSASRSETPLTVKEFASAIAAFKSSTPVSAIAPTPWLPPTMPSKLICTVLPPVVTVKFLFVLPSLLTVSSKVIISPLVVKVVFLPRTTAPL